jgi:hypothetical protein
VTNLEIKCLLGIILFSGILLVGLKYGTIGGAGLGAVRAKNPRLFWLAIGQNVIALVALITLFAFMLIGRIH